MHICRITPWRYTAHPSFSHARIPRNTHFRSRRFVTIGIRRIGRSANSLCAEAERSCKHLFKSQHLLVLNVSRLAKPARPGRGGASRSAVEGSYLSLSTSSIQTALPENLLPFCPAWRRSGFLDPSHQTDVLVRVRNQIIPNGIQSQNIRWHARRYECLAHPIRVLPFLDYCNDLLSRRTEGDQSLNLIDAVLKIAHNHFNARGHLSDSRRQLIADN
jgi:hypothetical protein